MKLHKILKHAFENIEYYKKYKNIDLNQESPTALEHLPILDKAYMREHLEDFIDDSIKCDELYDAISLDKSFKNEYTYKLNGKTVISEYTSGSSGIPFLSLKTPKERVLLGKQTWKLRNNIMPISSQNMFNFIHNFGDYPYPFPFYEEDTLEETIEKEMEFFSKNNYYWWHINQQKLNEYATYLNGKKWTSSIVKIIENNGAYLSKLEVEYYENMFGCKIINNYGCRELWTIAFEDVDGKLRINDSCVYFELVDDEGNLITEPYKEGYVVLTSLKQHIMPFIRYKIGDRAYYIDKGDKLKPRAIELCPDRAKIVGTDKYGNEVFRDVIFCLTYFKGIKNFDQISVVQKNTYQFEVNIRGNKENKETIESYIRKLARDALESDKYDFVFMYDDKKVQKSVFLVKMSQAVSDAK